MANKETVNKVKSLLEGHCYGPLRDAAEKWLAVADEKYDIKDKADKAWDKLNDAADKISEVSAKFDEKMGEASGKIADKYDELAEKSGPAFEKLADQAEKLTDKTSGAADKLQDVGEKLGDKAEELAKSELIKQLKEGINSVGDMLAHLSTKEAEEKWGEEAVAQMRAHVEELKARGEEFCDCDACRKARSILKDFGEDLDSKVEALKAYADKAEEVATGAAEAAEEAVEAASDTEE